MTRREFEREAFKIDKNINAITYTTHYDKGEIKFMTIWIHAEKGCLMSTTFELALIELKKRIIQDETRIK